MEEFKTFLMENVNPRNHDNEIIPDHITVLHGTKSKKQLSRKIKKKNVQLSRKASKEMGLYNIPVNSLIYNDFIPLNTLWNGYFREQLSLAVGNSVVIPDLLHPKYDEFCKTLHKIDFHGAILRVKQSKCSNLVNQIGIIVLETKNTFKIVSKNNKTKTIPKADCIFELITDFDNIKVTLFGKSLLMRSAERSVKKIRTNVNLHL